MCGVSSRQFTPSSGMTRLFMLGVLFTFPSCFRGKLSASPAMDTGRCFLFLLMLASDSGSALCCQQVTLARNSFGEVTDSFLTDLEEEALLNSDWEELDLTESLLFSSDLEDDFLTSDFSDVCCFHFILSAFIWRGTEARRYKFFCC